MADCNGKKNGKQGGRVERSLRVCCRGEGSLTVEVTVAEVVRYTITRLPCIFGEAFEVRKDGAEEAYQVVLEEEGHSCTCKGHGRWGHCRHQEACEALIKAGRL
jgi:hypothetical protein